jgi:hypothetical protein
MDVNSKPCLLENVSYSY